jgi:thiol-disulfide isomerase/thioredoxin
MDREVFVKLNRLRLLILLTFLALTVTLAGCSYSTDKSTSSSEQVPQFSLSNLDGKNVTLNDFADKVLLVDFWATWCGPCREEIPHLNKLYSNYKSRGFEILGISMDTEGAGPVKQFVKDFEIKYPVVMGDDNVAQDFGGIMGLPTTFIVDRKRNIVKKFIGLPPNEELEKTVRQLVRDRQQQVDGD